MKIYKITNILAKSLQRIIPIHPRWKLATHTVPFVLIILALKAFVHYFSCEFLSLNALFTAIISANIFLIGFLVSGVLADHKESEKIPGEMSASISSLADEGLILLKSKNTIEVKNYLLHLNLFCEKLQSWFYKQEKTKNLMEHILQFNDYFLAFEGQMQTGFILRLKSEQNQLRKMINRVHTIRETSFLATGYAIAEIIAFILTVGLIHVKVVPFYESLFFVSFISFVTIYMILLIKDLDNPFDYVKKDDSVEEISLKPIIDVHNSIKEYCKALTLTSQQQN